jgi:hypothetical protein
MLTVWRDLLDVHSARLAATAVPYEHEDALLVKLAVLLDGDSPVHPAGQELAPPVSHGHEAFPATSLRSVGEHEFHLGVCPIDDAPVAALPVRVDRAHEVQVRRHYLASISRSAIARSRRIRAGCTWIAVDPLP